LDTPSAGRRLSTVAPGAARQRHRRHGTPQSHAGRQPATCIARACWVPNSLASVSRRASTTRYDLRIVLRGVAVLWAGPHTALRSRGALL